MADVGIEQLKEDIQDNIKTNNSQAITGAVLQEQLIDTVDTLKGYTDDHVSVSQNTQNVTIIQVGNQTPIEIRPIEIEGNVTNNPDNEDLTSVEQDGVNVLKFKDRQYQSGSDNGMGYVILRKDKTFAEQIANKANTIFEIRYDFDLDGETITVPDNCILKFEGGLLKNGTITSENNINLSIEAKEERIFEDVEFSSNIHLLNSDIFLNWFCKNTLTDNTQTIQKILNSFKECVLSSNTTYLVNGTIILQENQCLKFNWNSCLQKSSGTGPIIHIKGSYNSILGQGKGGFLKSSIISPNGLICVGEYGDYILDNMVCHNKIDGLILEGTISNTTDYSIGMLCKNTGYNVGAYRNSISNVDIRFFNIGVAIRGGFNGNFLRDMHFYACGGDYPSAPYYHTRTDDEAPIIVESWDTPQGVDFDWGEVLENTISNINVGYSPNTIALLFVGSVKWHMVDNFVAEQEGLNALEFSWREKNHNGTDYIPKWNSVAIAGNTYLGPNYGGDFQNYNTYLSTSAMSFSCPSITGQNLRANQQLRVQDRYIDDSQDSWIGRNTQTAKYSVSDSTKYILGRLALRDGYGTEGIFLRIIFTSISGGYIGLASIFNILIIRRESSTIESKVWGKYWDEGYRLLEIIKNNNNTIDIEFRSPAFGVEGTSLMRVTTEFYTRQDCTFTLYSSATPSSNNKSEINCADGGWTSQKPTYPEVGQNFYDKDFNKPIWWTGNAWVGIDGITPYILRYGSTSQRPAFADIYQGFKYYDTTLNMEIINDNGTWVDCNGRTPGKHSGGLADMPNFISGTAGANDDGYMFTFTDDATYGNKIVWWNTNAGGWVDATSTVVIPIP